MDHDYSKNGITPEALLGELNEVERKHAPERLYLQGNIDLLRQGLRVAVVGSRSVSDHGKRRARSLVKTLVEHDVTVVSGLAQGVDTIAHTTALECGGNTVAVIGTPLDSFYPKENRQLQETIARQHAVVSQFASGKPVTKRSFPMRNRTMALLSDATIIVEAGEKSGTIHQAWEALRLGRILFIMESLLESGLDWPDELVKYGAQVLTRNSLVNYLENSHRLDWDEVVAF